MDSDSIINLSGGSVPWQKNAAILHTSRRQDN